MPQSHPKGPTTEQLIEALKKRGVKVKTRNLQLHSSSSLRVCEIYEFSYIVVPRRYIAFQPLAPGESVDKFVIRSLCNNLHLDSTDIEFELLAQSASSDAETLE